MHVTNPQRSGSRLARWAERRPLFFGLMVLVSIWVTFIITMKLLQGPLAGVVSRDMFGILASVVVSAGFAGLATAMGWWREAGFRAPGSWRVLRVMWLPALVLIAQYGGVKVSTPSGLAMIFAGAAITALLEGLIFRGLVLRAFLPGGAVKAVVASSVFFALMHLDRLVDGASPGDTLIQLALSVAGGIFMGALTLRTGSIWPSLVYHTLYDFLVWLGLGGMQMSVEPTLMWKVTMVVSQLVLCTYGVILLRGMRGGKEVSR